MGLSVNTLERMQRVCRVLERKSMVVIWQVKYLVVRWSERSLWSWFDYLMSTAKLTKWNQGKRKRYLKIINLSENVSIQRRMLAAPAQTYGKTSPLVKSRLSDLLHAVQCLTPATGALSMDLLTIWSNLWQSLAGLRMNLSFWTRHVYNMHGLALLPHSQRPALLFGYKILVALKPPVVVLVLFEDAINVLGLLKHHLHHFKYTSQHCITHTKGALSFFIAE